MFLKKLLAFDFSTKCFSKSLLLRTILFVRRIIIESTLCQFALSALVAWLKGIINYCL